MRDKRCVESRRIGLANRKKKGLRVVVSDSGQVRVNLSCAGSWTGEKTTRVNVADSKQVKEQSIPGQSNGAKLGSPSAHGKDRSG